MSKNGLIAKILRHHPEIFNVEMDEEGWVDVNQLVLAVSRQYDFSKEELEKIVETNSKQRYTFDDTKTKIRANQGHSIEVDLKLKEAIPPAVLYHGTSTKAVVSISQSGILPMKRQYVHCSTDIQTAAHIGKRHGKSFVYQIDAKAMHEDGFSFYLSDNQIWLTKAVPVKYLSPVIKKEKAIDSFPTLKTSRLILRRCTLNDVTSLFKLRSQHQLHEYTDTIPDKTPKDTKDYILRMNQGIDQEKWILWAIETKEKELIGTICFWNINEEKTVGELGFGLHPDYWNQGYMKEALLAVYRYLTDKLHFQLIEAYTEKNNQHCIHLLESSGFIQDGSIIEKGIHHDRNYEMLNYKKKKEA